MLDQKLLEDLLLDSVFDKTDEKRIIDGWVNSYHTYASGALSSNGVPMLPKINEPNRLVLKPLMAGALLTPKSPQHWAYMLGTALATYWISPPIAFAPTPPQTWAATLAVPALFIPPIQVALLENFARSKFFPSKRDTARSIAAAVHLATKTVTTTYAGVGGGVGPIS